MRDNKPTALKYFEAYQSGDVNTILEIVSSGAKIQSGQQDWVSAPMILPNLLSATSDMKYTMHELFSNDDDSHFIFHFHAVDAKGVKVEYFKVIEFDIYGKIDFIRVVTND